MYYVYADVYFTGRQDPLNQILFDWSADLMKSKRNSLAVVETRFTIILIILPDL